MNTIEELIRRLNGGSLITIRPAYPARCSISADLIKTVGTPGPDVHCLNEAGANFALLTLEGRAYFKVLGDMPAVPWDKNIVAELATNDNCPGSLADGWWQRELSQITGLTFHHTLSDSPHATASRYVKKDGGRPSIPYTIWISQTGEILLCNALEEGCWHNHQGHKNKQLSIGLAGSLHIHRPAEVQLDAAARVAVWAICHPEMNVELETVKGHCDYIATQCPGWDSAASGHWKPELYEMIEALL